MLSTAALLVVIHAIGGTTDVASQVDALARQALAAVRDKDGAAIERLFPSVEEMVGCGFDERMSLEQAAGRRTAIEKKLASCAGFDLSHAQILSGDASSSTNVGCRKGVVVVLGLAPDLHTGPQPILLLDELLELADGTLRLRDAPECRTVAAGDLRPFTAAGRAEARAAAAEAAEAREQAAATARRAAEAADMARRIPISELLRLPDLKTFLRDPRRDAQTGSAVVDFFGTPGVAVPRFVSSQLVAIDIGIDSTVATVKALSGGRPPKLSTVIEALDDAFPEHDTVILPDDTLYRWRRPRMQVVLADNTGFMVDDTAHVTALALEVRGPTPKVRVVFPGVPPSITWGMSEKELGRMKLPMPVVPFSSMPVNTSGAVIRGDALYQMSSEASSTSRDAACGWVADVSRALAALSPPADLETRCRATTDDRLALAFTGPNGEEVLLFVSDTSVDDRPKFRHSLTVTFPPVVASAEARFAAATRQRDRADSVAQRRADLQRRVCPPPLPDDLRRLLPGHRGPFVLAFLEGGSTDADIARVMSPFRSVQRSLEGSDLRGVVVSNAPLPPGATAPWPTTVDKDHHLLEGLRARESVVGPLPWLAILDRRGALVWQGPPPVKTAKGSWVATVRSVVLEPARPNCVQRAR